MLKSNKKLSGNFDVLIKKQRVFYEGGKTIVPTHFQALLK